MAKSTTKPLKKLAVVTGAARGNGKAIAKALAGMGATVVVVDIGQDLPEVPYALSSPAELAATTEELRRIHPRIFSLQMDVRDEGSVRAGFAQVAREHGTVDILVNNAGVNIQKRRLHELSGEDWDQVVSVNLTGAFNMVQAVLPPMRTQGGGLIVNVSSQAGVTISGLSGAAYTSSKHGFNALSHSINQEEWRNGIRACALCPGEVNTEILDKRPIPIPPEERERLIQPEDMAEAVRFVACMPARTNITEMRILPTHKRAMRPGETG